MPIIIIIILAIFGVLIVGTWHYLGNIEKNKKILFILIGIFLSYIITIIIFLISKADISYPSEQIEKVVQNTIVFVFTGLNGILILPYTGRLFDKINEQEITKNQLKKVIVVLFIIFAFILVFESNYLNGTQRGILEIYQKSLNK